MNHSTVLRAAAVPGKLILISTFVLKANMLYDHFPFYVLPFSKIARFQVKISGPDMSYISIDKLMTGRRMAKDVIHSPAEGC